MAVKSIDILLADNYDLKVVNGDFVLGEADEQNIELITISAPGNWKEAPLTGFNILRFIQGPGDTRDKFERDLRLYLDDMDIYKVGKIDTSEGYQNLKLEAERK